MSRRRSTAIVSLDDHPNLSEVLGVLAQLPHVSDRDLPRLAKQSVGVQKYPDRKELLISLLRYVYDRTNDERTLARRAATRVVTL